MASVCLEKWDLMFVETDPDSLIKKCLCSFALLASLSRPSYSSCFAINEGPCFACYQILYQPQFSAHFPKH